MQYPANFRETLSQLHFIVKLSRNFGDVSRPLNLCFVYVSKREAKEPFKQMIYRAVDNM